MSEKVKRTSKAYQLGYLKGSILALRDAYRYEQADQIKMHLRVNVRTLYRIRHLHKRMNLKS